MGCPSARDFLVWSLFASTFLYAFVAISFKYTWDQKCSGEWGNWNPPMVDKNGNGRCSLGFELRFTPTNKTLLNWETSYIGEWKFGAKDGYGTYTSLSGLQYIGDWRKDLRHGFGTLKLTDGTQYIGSWKEDKFIGDNNKMILGKYKRESEIIVSPLFNISGSFFEGRVVDGVMEGNGSIIFPSKTNGALSKRGLVIGEFSNGLFQKGKIVLTDGNSAKTVSFQNDWDLGNKYSANAVLQISFLDKEGSVTTKNCDWDGTSLFVKEDQVKLEPKDYILVNTTDISSEEQKKITRSLHELQDLLHHLKWFQFHFLYSRVALDLEAYTFEKVDSAPAPAKVNLKEELAKEEL